MAKAGIRFLTIHRGLRNSGWLPRNPLRFDPGGRGRQCCFPLSARRHLWSCTIGLSQDIDPQMT